MVRLRKRMKALVAKISTYRLVETFSFILIWGLIMLSPLLVYRYEGQLLWGDILTSWSLLSVLLLVFILNMYLLIPRFLHRKRYLHYILILFAILPMLCCWEMQLTGFIDKQPVLAMPSMDRGAPFEFSSEMPAPEGFKTQNSDSTTKETHFWMHLLLAFLVTGSTAAYKMLFYWIQEEKARKQMETRLKNETDLQPDFILVKSDYKIVKIATDDILYIESANEYVKIYLTSGEMIMTFVRLKNMENDLPQRKFMRVQRSFIVNLEKIKAVEKNKIHIEHKKVIPIGEQYKESFQEFLGKGFMK